jgi:endonuclease YncB( thermonuclease family)
MEPVFDEVPIRRPERTRAYQYEPDLTREPEPEPEPFRLSDEHTYTPEVIDATTLQVLDTTDFPPVLETQTPSTHHGSVVEGGRMSGDPITISTLANQTHRAGDWSLTPIPALVPHSAKGSKVGWAFRLSGLIALIALAAAFGGNRLPDAGRLTDRASTIVAPGTGNPGGNVAQVIPTATATLPVVDVNQPTEQAARTAIALGVGGETAEPTEAAATPSETATRTPTATATAPLPTATATAPLAPTPTTMGYWPVLVTPEPTEEPTLEPTAAETETPTPEPTATNTPEPTATETPTEEPTDTPTEVPTATHTPSPEPTETPTVEPTATETPTTEPTATSTVEPTATDTPSPEPTATDTPTTEPTATATETEEPIFGPPAPTSETPTDVPTDTPTTEPTATATPTSVPTDTPTIEPTATETATWTPEPTNTATPSPTPSPTETATNTPEPTPTPGFPPQERTVSEGSNPDQVFSTGAFRYTVEFAERGAEIPPLSLAAVPGREWVVVVLHAQNWSDEPATLNMADFQLLVSGDFGWQFVGMDASSPDISRFLGFDPVLGTSELSSIKDGEGLRMALVYSIPPTTTNIELIDDTSGLNIGSSLADGGDVTSLGKSPKQPDLLAATVTAVIDGRTIVVEAEGKQATIQYLGVNVPTGNQCYAADATQTNSNIVLGETVYLEREFRNRVVNGEDTFARDVWITNNQGGLVLVSAWLASEGAAAPAPDANDTRFAGWIEAASNAAEANGLGFWGVCGAAPTQGLTSDLVQVSPADLPVDPEVPFR